MEEKNTINSQVFNLTKDTLNLSVDNAVSVDSVVSPFIVLEYLIKI